ncbi:MAG TPA: hypothetical protein VEY10_01835 [Flavisolibacter sp.]|jgi:hypothetical protein|nr:hypothetical protein [Flavisolibacter sp.]
MTSVKSLLAVVIIAVLTTGCVTTQEAVGDDYDEDVRTQQSGNRLYVQDPFYGTVVLERDPFSGRYYDVTNGYRGFPSRYNGLNTYRRNGNYNRNYGTYNRSFGNRSVGTIQRPAPQQPTQKTREDARKIILGNKN